MITGNQILCHLIGDYILQNSWMANNKTRDSFAAAVHALAYSLPFLFLRPAVLAFVFIVTTHFLIDRFRLARYVIWLKEGARGTVTATGYAAGTPDWLSVWLLIICDNTLHLLCNGLAFAYL